MKSLASILKQQSPQEGFPIRGENGYGGEQDGSTPILTQFRSKTKKEAEKLMIPDGVSLHWAEYNPNEGWTGVVGHWSNDDTITEYTL